MPINEITVKQATCQRCGHMWIPRDHLKIKVCAKCKSPYWDTPRKEKLAAAKFFRDIDVMFGNKGDK